jgi:DNA-binding CsgD family transcriptional regulator
MTRTGGQPGRSGAVFIGRGAVDDSGHRPRSQARTATFPLGNVADLSVPLHAGSAMRALTPAEREVAALAAAGLSNQAIATCTGKAVRTVANQMASILSKLHVGSRYNLRVSLALGSRREDER